jgi:4-methylaminobutanoate oxidase (formaldehyde-forming)
VAWDKPGGFIGRQAALAQKQAGPLSKKLLQILVLDPEPLLFHGEVVRRDGAMVGYIRAASYGHTLGGSVGLAMVETLTGEPLDQAWIDGGDWTIEVADRTYPVKASLRPLFDPKNEKIKA